MFCIVHNLYTCRLDSFRNDEYDGRVVAIDQAKCFLLMPDAWWMTLERLQKQQSENKDRSVTGDAIWPTLQDSMASARTETDQLRTIPPLAHIR